MLSMVRGQKIKLSDVTKNSKIQVGLAVTAPAGMAFDISCFGVDAQEKLSDDRYFVFYNQKRSPNGEIVSMGASGNDLEKFQIDLSLLPANIRKLVFIITLDGPGSMAQIQRGGLRLIAQSVEVADFTFTGSDFSGEKAIIVAEIYLKDFWRLSAVGQGFNGGLSELLKHFGGEEINDNAESLKVSKKKLELEKLFEKEMPRLVSLAKSLNLSLEKNKLLDVVAKVALVLDASGSMEFQYSGGDVQLVVDKIVPLAVQFDDDGELETWAFASKAKTCKKITLKNVDGYVKKLINIEGFEIIGGLGCSNNEPVVMQEIINNFKNSNIPAYVIFVSDGGVDENAKIEKLIIESSKYPIFWQFVGLGGEDYGILEHLDTMKGRIVDNCNFFALDDIRSVTDQELYDRLLNEFPSWLKEAKKNNIIS